MDDPDPLRESQPNSSGPDTAAGTMGVSSERVGPAGPGQEATDGQRDTSPGHVEADVPEATTGNEEPHPEGLPPKAGYPSVDPRSD